MDSPIFILGAHKSGTSLLRSLFDGHPDLYVIPFETHVFKQLNYPIQNPYFTNRPKSIAVEKGNFINHLNHINQSEDAYADSINTNRFKGETFADNLDVSGTNKEIINSYFESIYRADSRMDNSSIQRIVEKSVTHHEHALELSLMYPNAKFIHVVRNPYANWVALRKYRSISKGGPLLYRIANSLENNYYFLERNKRTIDNYYVLKYEDLLLDVESTMKSLCSFSDVNYHDTLINPTANGEKWLGNSTTNKKFNEVNSDNIERWKATVKPIDIYYVNQLFNSIIHNYGYELIANKSGFYKKLPKEGMAKYLMNRFYKLYLKQYS